MFRRDTLSCLPTPYRASQRASRDKPKEKGTGRDSGDNLLYLGEINILSP